MTLVEKISDYLRSSKAEMFKVSWPSRRDTLRYSALIIGISVIVAVFFASLDLGFTRLFDVTILSVAKTRSLQVKPVEQNTVTPVAPTTQPSGSVDLNQAKPIETPKK